MLFRSAPKVEGPVRSKLEELENCFNVVVTAGGVVLSEIDDLTAAVACALVATRSGGNAEATPTRTKVENVIIKYAIHTLTVLIPTLSMPRGLPGRYSAL